MIENQINELVYNEDIHADLINIFGVQFYIFSFKDLCTLNLSQTCSKKIKKFWNTIFRKEIFWISSSWG